MQHKITKKFSAEVDKQINQFGIDLIADISEQIDAELDSQQIVLGLTMHQVSTFRAVPENARQKVLAKYQLETKDSRKDTPYIGESH